MSTIVFCGLRLRKAGGTTSTPLPSVAMDYDLFNRCASAPTNVPSPKPGPFLHRIEKRLVAEQEGRYYLHPWEKE